MAKPPPGEKFYVAVVTTRSGHNEWLPRLCAASLSQVDGYTEKEMDALVVGGYVREEFAGRFRNPFNAFNVTDVRRLKFILYAVVETDGTVVSAAVTNGHCLVTRAQLRDMRAGSWLDDGGREAVDRVWEAIQHLWEDDPPHLDDLLPENYVFPARMPLTEG